MGTSQLAVENAGSRTVVVSGGGSARRDFEEPKNPAAATKVPAKKRRRLCIAGIGASRTIQAAKGS
jgi:hypothetical protein